MHCGVSAAIVSSLCFTSDESLVHSIHPCTGVYRRTQCFKKYPVSLTKSTSLTLRNSCNMEPYLMHNFEYLEFSLINPTHLVFLTRLEKFFRPCNSSDRATHPTEKFIRLSNSSDWVIHPTEWILRLSNSSDWVILPTEYFFRPSISSEQVFHPS